MKNPEEILKEVEYDYNASINDILVTAMTRYAVLWRLHQNDLEKTPLVTDSVRNEKLIELTKRLKAAIAFATENEKDMDAISWGYQEGTLISFNEAEMILSKLEQK